MKLRARRALGRRRDVARLAALADGSLPEPERGRLLERVREEPELARALATQQRMAVLLRDVAASAPESLRERVVELAQSPDAAAVRGDRAPRLRPRRRPAIALASAALIAATITLALLGTTSPPGVAAAAALTERAATLPAPGASGTRPGTLSESVEGVSYPYWADRFGWRASGARSDQLAGHRVTTVFYADMAGRRVGYAIVGGSALSTPGGALHERAGVAYRSLRSGGLRVVTWQRDGHTCVLASSSVPDRALLALAAWG